MGSVATVSGSILLVGFLLGLKHALEADHVAAVATLASRSSSLRAHVRLAGLWGIGHAVALAALGSLLVLLGAGVPRAATATLEAAVGIVLIALGADVLRRLRRDRVHFHVHRHAGAPPHFHAHTHRGATTHDAAAHEHHHPSGIRALAVGSLHGLAGSAALVLLAAEGGRSVGQALAYLALFGAGTILGMMTLSLAIAVPFRLSADRLGRRQDLLQAALGTATIGLGIWITWQHLTP